MGYIVIPIISVISDCLPLESFAHNFNELIFVMQNSVLVAALLLPKIIQIYNNLR